MATSAAHISHEGGGIFGKRNSMLPSPLLTDFRDIISIRAINMFRLFSFALVPLAVCAQNGPFMGLVERVDPPGSFTRISDSKSLRQFDEVFPGTSVHPSNRTSGFIRIVYLAGGKWELRCTPKEPCKESYEIRVPTSRAPSYFVKPPKLSSVFATQRGLVANSLTGLPKEAVIPAQGDRVSLSAALANVAPGSYRVSISDPDQSGVRKQFNLNLPQQSEITLPNLTPGILALALTTVRGNTVGNVTAILVASPEQYQRWVEAFQAAEDTTATWDGVDDEFKRQFLVGTLYSIYETLQ
jgi:hypothetical protein